MSDTRLRDLERAGTAGDLEAYGRFLQELVRQGQLDEERVELLAYLLWPPAWQALGWEDRGYSGAPSEGFRSKLFKRPGQEQLYEINVRLETWPGGLLRWGGEPALRAGVAAARFRYPGWAEEYDALAETEKAMPCEKERIKTLIYMVELHVMNPTGYPLVYLDGDYQPLYTSAPKHVLGHEGRLLVTAGPVHAGFRTMSLDTRIMPKFAGLLGVFAGSRGSLQRLLGAALVDCCDTRTHDGNWDQHVRRREEAVFQAIRAELVPWVLGKGDAVAERVHD